MLHHIIGKSSYNKLQAVVMPASFWYANSEDKLGTGSYYTLIKIHRRRP